MKDARYDQGIGCFIIYQMLTKVKECIDISGGQCTIVPLNTYYILKPCAVILYYIGKSKSDF